MDRNTQIVEMVRNGLTRAEVARQFGLSNERVRQIVNPVLGKASDAVVPVTDKELRVITDLARSGLHARAIAEVVGRSSTTVINACRKNSVALVNAGDVFGDELRKKAIELVASGLTCSEAANHLNMTRNAVIGACWRHRQAKKARKG